VYIYISIYIYIYIYIYIISVCVFISITPLFASTSTCTSLDRGDAISGIQGQWQDAVEDLLLNRRQSGDVWSFEGSTQREASHPNVWSEVPYFWGWKGRKALSLVVSFSSLPVPSLYVVDGTDVHITQQCDGRAASIVLTEQRQQVLLPPVRLSQTESDNLFEYVWVRAARFAWSFTHPSILRIVSQMYTFGGGWSKLKALSSNHKA